jgi:DNA-binding FadR family transcriptional regulator
MRTARVKGSYEKANYWHRKIYGAVLQQKPVEAEQAVLEHLSQTLMDVRHNTEGEEL